MRSAVLLACVIAAAVILPAQAQQQGTSVVVDHALHSGDGQSPGRAYMVPGLLWEYVVLEHLHLRFRKQRFDKEYGTDIITVRDPKTGLMQDVWFRASVPNIPAQAETDRVIRPIVTSGDGASPETAFVVGGNIDAEYKILRYMGIESDLQALMTIRGCSFDRLSGHDLDTNEPRQVYFKLGSPNFDYRGGCVLQPNP